MPLIGLIDDNGEMLTFQEIEHGKGYWVKPIHATLSMYIPRERYCYISASQLVEDFRFLLLEDRYNYYVHPDSMLPLIDGNAHHLYFSYSMGEGVESEIEYDVELCGITVGGKPDVFIVTDITEDYTVGNLWDLKRAGMSVIDFIQEVGVEAAKQNNVWQIRIYAWLLSKHNRRTDKAFLWFSGRDYRRKERILNENLMARHLNGDSYKSGKNKGEPVSKPRDYVSDLIYQIDVSDLDGTESYVKSRLRQYNELKEKDDDSLPVCNTWKDDIRCKEFCPVKQFCNYGRKLQ